MITNFNSLWFDPTGYRTRFYRRLELSAFFRWMRSQCNGNTTLQNTNWAGKFRREKQPSPHQSESALSSHRRPLLMDIGYMLVVSYNLLFRAVKILLVGNVVVVCCFKSNFSVSKLLFLSPGFINLATQTATIALEWAPICNGGSSAPVRVSLFKQAETVPWWDSDTLVP